VRNGLVKRGGVTSGNNTVNTRVHALPRALVIAASLSCVPFSVWIFGPYPRSILIGLVAAAIPIIPMYASGPRAFRRIRVVEGSILLVAGVCGFFVGLFLFVPAGVLLIIAGVADPGDGRQGAHVVGAVGAVVVILAAVGFSVASTRRTTPPPTCTSRRSHLTSMSSRTTTPLPTRPEPGSDMARPPYGT
jgi:hypothetical protein